MPTVEMLRSMNVAGRQRFTHEKVDVRDEAEAELIVRQGHARLVKSQAAQVVETAARVVPAVRTAAKKATAKKTAAKKATAKRR